MADCNDKIKVKIILLDLNKNIADMEMTEQFWKDTNDELGNQQFNCFFSQMTQRTALTNDSKVIVRQHRCFA